MKKLNVAIMLLCSPPAFADSFEDFVGVYIPMEFPNIIQTASSPCGHWAKLTNLDHLSITKVSLNEYKFSTMEKENCVTLGGTRTCSSVGGSYDFKLYNYIDNSGERQIGEFETAQQGLSTYTMKTEGIGFMEAMSFSFQDVGGNHFRLKQTYKFSSASEMTACESGISLLKL